MARTRSEKTKKQDPMARQVAKLVRGRPWLGWRHRRPMDDYTQARKRGLVVQAAMNGGGVVFNVATGQYVAVPFMVLFTAQMVRNHRRLSADPTGFQAEWQEIRDTLAEVDAERALGIGRRLPSAKSLLVLPLVFVLAALQFKLLLPGVSWGILLAGGLAAGVLADLADIALHLRNAPAAVEAAEVVVIDLPALEAQLTEAVDVDVFPIRDYDALTVNQILPLLPKLYWDEVPVVLDRERVGKARRTVLARLEQYEALLDDAPDEVTVEDWLLATGRTRVRREVEPA